MLKITLRQLESFAAIVDMNSFSKAAESLNLTQSTVSMHVHSLEEILQKKLIIRGAGLKITLTEDGQKIYGTTKDILRSCDAIEKMQPRTNDNILTIGASTVPSQSILPYLMAKFRSKHNNVCYMMHRGDSKQIHSLLQREKIRIGFVGKIMDNKSFIYWPLVRDELIVVTQNNGHFMKLKEQGATGLDLLGENLIARESGSGTQIAVDNYLIEKSIDIRQLNIIANFDNTGVIKKSVIEGLGISILSNLVVSEEIKNGSLIPFAFERPGVKRTIYLAWCCDTILSGIEQCFVNFVKEETPKFLQNI